MDIPESLAEVVTALSRLADAADRAVFLGEALAVHLGVVIPEDVDMEMEEVPK